MAVWRGIGGAAILIAVVSAVACVDILDLGALSDTPSDGGGEGGAVVQLHVVVAGAGSNTVSISPSGASCGAGCYEVPIGTQVTLEAVPSKFFGLLSWSACPSPTSTCTVTLNADLEVTATFANVNVVFVTSKTFLAGSLGSVEAANQRCASAATAGSLGGHFIALLSISGADFASAVPSSVRGWVRTDGLPAFDTLSDLFNRYEMFYPVFYDEYGHGLAWDNSAKVVTGSTSHGTYDGAGDCSGLTSTTGKITAGNPFNGFVAFINSGGSDCSADAHLYCVQIDEATPLPRPTLPPDARIAFLTNGVVNSGGGTAAFDKRCATEAAKAGLDGGFLAALATGDAGPDIRFDLDGGVWRRPDGVVLSATPADLFTPTPSSALAGCSQHADGTYVTTFPSYFWGGANTAVHWTCNDWTDNTSSAMGGIGEATSARRLFQADLGSLCNSAYPVCCLQQ